MCYSLPLLKQGAYRPNPPPVEADHSRTYTEGGSPIQLTGHYRHMSMDRALFQQVRETRRGKKNPLSEITFCHSPLNIHIYTECNVSETSHWTLTIFRGTCAYNTHCRYTCSQISQSSLSLRYFKPLISVHFCWYIFKTTPQHLQAHLNLTARCCAEVPVLTGSREVPLPPCSFGPAWISRADRELLIAAPPQLTASRGLGEELRSAQHRAAWAPSAAQPWLRHPRHLWCIEETYQNSHGLELLIGFIAGRRRKEMLVVMVGLFWWGIFVVVVGVFFSKFSFLLNIEHRTNTTTATFSITKRHLQFVAVTNSRFGCSLSCLSLYCLWIFFYLNSNY